MQLIGLTGGIASGKSSVARILRQMGVPVIDADQVGHQLIAPGTPAYQEICHNFGTQILAPDGTIDRLKLGERVFADPAERERLNAITHPKIGAQVAEITQQFALQGHSRVVYEAPLLIEAGHHEVVDRIIVVSVPVEVQIQRLCARNNLDRTAAKARLAAQMSLEDKLAFADYVIENDGSVEQLAERVNAVWEAICRD